MDYHFQYGIFFEENNTGILSKPSNNEDIFSESLPYLQKGDSSKYLDQFLCKEEPVVAAQPQKLQKENQVSPSSESIDQYSIQNNVKFNTSSFHNFQKHLTVCLRNVINIKSENQTAKDYQVAGAKLWKEFHQSSNSTKKILHYLLGEKNEHKITNEGLRQYGLHKVVEEYDEKTIRLAKNYLREETLRQIKEGKVNDYIKAKKLKDKQKFERYVEFFIEELQEGFLRKRLPKQKVYELQRS